MSESEAYPTFHMPEDAEALRRWLKEGSTLEAAIASRDKIKEDVDTGKGPE